MGRVTGHGTPKHATELYRTGTSPQGRDGPRLTIRMPRRAADLTKQIRRPVGLSPHGPPQIFQAILDRRRRGYSAIEQAESTMASIFSSESSPLATAWLAVTLPALKQTTVRSASGAIL